MLGWKNKPLSEQAEDLECLCHLMKTCGRILDTPAGKYRMDQYFERMDQVIDSEKMPLRIRFMVQDIVEMRRNKWTPRRAGREPERGPRTIQQVREDAYRDGFIYMPQDDAPPSKISHAVDLMHPFEEVFRKQDDFFGSGFGGVTCSGSTASASGYMTGGYFGTGSVTGGYDDSDTREESANIPAPAPVAQPMQRSYREVPVEKIRFADEDSTSTNNNSDISLNLRRDSSQSGSGDAHSSSSQPHYQREKGFNDGRNYNKRGGGHFKGHGEEKHTPPPDFGDRYSANRSKNRHYGGDFDNRGGRQDRGMYHNRGNRFDSNYRNNNHQGGGGPRFHRNDMGYGGEQSHPPRFQDRQEESNMNNLPPRFNKKPPHQHQFTSQNPLAGSKDVELSLRPASGTMLFKPKTPSLLPKSALGRSDASPHGDNAMNNPLPSLAGKMMVQKESAILIKQGSLDNKKRDKKAATKGPVKAEVLAKVESFVQEMISKRDVTVAMENWMDGESIPSKHLVDAIAQIYASMAKEESGDNRALIKSMISKLVDNESISATNIQESFCKVFNSLDRELNKDSRNAELIADNVADFAAWNIEEGFDTLKGVADAISQVSPRTKQLKITLLRVLAVICGAFGNNKVKSMFDEANIKISEHVDDVKTDSQLAETLNDFDLSFLMPLLSIRQDMVSHLKNDGNAESLMGWVSDNVDVEFHSQPEFITSLYSVVLNHIFEKTTGLPGADKSAQPDKSAVEQEKEMIGRFKQILHHFVAKKSSLQLVAVYALQVYCYELDFPKGLLLRTFVNCYEQDVLDEHAFLQWREDVSDKYPGKGKALFQVGRDIIFFNVFKSFSIFFCFNRLTLG